MAAGSDPNERRFERRDLADAVFHDCSLARARFDDVDLSGGAFSNVALKRARFTDVNLAGVVIEDANIDGLTIHGHDIAALIRAEIARREELGLFGPIAIGTVCAVCAIYCAARAVVAFRRKRTSYGLGLCACALMLLSIPIIQVLVFTSGGL